jgi:hypothetical protein
MQANRRGTDDPGMAQRAILSHILAPKPRLLAG